MNTLVCVCERDIDVWKSEKNEHFVYVCGRETLMSEKVKRMNTLVYVCERETLMSDKVKRMISGDHLF